MYARDRTEVGTDFRTLALEKLIREKQLEKYNPSKSPELKADKEKKASQEA